MIKKIYLIIFIMSLGHLAATDTEKKQNQSQTLMPASLGSEIVKRITSKKTTQTTTKTTVSKKTSEKQAGNKKSKSAPLQKNEQATTKVSGAAVTSFKTPLIKSTPPMIKTPVSRPAKVYMPPPAPILTVPQIRQEVQKIIDLNKQIQNVQAGKTIRFQRIQTQALVHQKILNELETQQKKEAGQKPPQKESLIAQEKLRIIQEETERNAQMMKEAVENPNQLNTPQLSQGVEVVVESTSSIQKKASTQSTNTSKASQPSGA